MIRYCRRCGRPYESPNPRREHCSIECIRHAAADQLYHGRARRRLQAKVVHDLATGCWAWAGARNRNTGPMMRYRGRVMAAHRVAYMVYIGAIPEGHDVLRTCGTPECVNPEHLVAVPAGDAQRRQSPLSPADVRAIRAALAAGRSARDLAADYAVHPETIRQIGLRLRWAHVE